MKKTRTAQHRAAHRRGTVETVEVRAADGIGSAGEVVDRSRAGRDGVVGVGVLAAVFLGMLMVYSGVALWWGLSTAVAVSLPTALGGVAVALVRRSVEPPRRPIPAVRRIPVITVATRLDSDTQRQESPAQPPTL
jgi:hypothetical protein